MKERDTSIDWLKLVAVLLIINSHLAPLYGKYDFLARGGVFGVALFFFCSGYTLFLKPLGGIRQFPNWYKRRISRIYPSVLAFAIITCTFLHDRQTINHIILHAHGWFVPCIMTYYIPIFFIGSYLKDKLRWVVFLQLLVVIGCFFHEYREPGFFMYADPFQRIPFFMFMLMGAMLGVSGGKIKVRPLVDACLAVVSVVGYYLLLFLSMRSDRLAMMELLSYFPLMAFVYYSYKVFKADWAKRTYNRPAFQWVIRVIGGLCLEIYLVQFKLITDKLNHLFPLNFLIIFVGIILLAYLTRCLARWLLQTFGEAPYDWRKIFSAK